MKNVFRILGLFLLSAFIFTAVSCSSDDDPTDNDYFIGKYTGPIHYEDGTTNITKDNGTVTVIKIASGTKYNFAFSDGIPDLNGVEFNKTGDHTLVSIGGGTAGVITINENTLTIAYNKDGKTWTANCHR